MNNPLEITFKGIEHSKRIELVIQEKFDKIQKIGKDIIKCHIIMESLSKHHQKGNHYIVRLDLKLADFSDIVIKEKSQENEVHLATVVREVFKKALEQISKQIGKRKKNVPRPDKEGELNINEVSEDEETLI
ncbi:MAG: HPF/RaiA family ribosome-associated protein [Candidatus Omnitrophica bacterium]|nr:HPF/RaiA family ribosome-associated protein [Candidatus Omnitrophota bacterium]